MPWDILKYNYPSNCNSSLLFTFLIWSWMHRVHVHVLFTLTLNFFSNTPALATHWKRRWFEFENFLKRRKIVSAVLCIKALTICLLFPAASRSPRLSLNSLKGIYVLIYIYGFHNPPPPTHIFFPTAIKPQSWYVGAHCDKYTVYICTVEKFSGVAWISGFCVA